MKNGVEGNGFALSVGVQTAIFLERKYPLSSSGLMFTPELLLYLVTKATTTPMGDNGARNSRFQESSAFRIDRDRLQDLVLLMFLVLEQAITLCSSTAR